MRERTGQAEYDEEQYHAGEFLQSPTSKKRLNLNDLLKRSKDQEKNDIKLNLLIYSGTASVIALFVLFLSL